MQICRGKSEPAILVNEFPPALPFHFTCKFGPLKFHVMHKFEPLIKYVTFIISHVYLWYSIVCENSESICENSTQNICSLSNKSK